MTESMNLDTNDIVSSLSGFDSFQAELDILNETSEEHVRVVHAEDMDVMTILPKSDLIKSDLLGGMEEEHIVDDDPEDEDMGDSMNSHLDETITEDMIDGNVNEIMHVMDLQGDEELMQDEDESHEGKITGHDHFRQENRHGLFSGVIGDEEIIDDSQVITEDVDILSEDNMDEQILEDSDVKYLDDIMNDNVNETVIEAGEVEDRTGECEPFDCQDEDEDDEEIAMESVPTIITMEPMTEDEKAELMTTGEISTELSAGITENTPVIVKGSTGNLQVLKTTNRVDRVKTLTSAAVPPLTVVSKSDAQVQEAVKSITSGVFVLNSSGSATPITQTIIQSGGTLIAPKDTQKFSRVVTIPNIDASSGQTIRIVAPPGKFNSTTKAITFAQARRMGLIPASGRINNILPTSAKPNQQIGIGKLVMPASKKTVTVVKPPAKILPAPPISSHKPQKVLIRQANSVKTGTIVASGSTAHSPGTHMIRFPANQTLQQILPGGSKQIQYVKLVSTSGTNKGHTLVPLSLSKTIPMLTTNLINSPTTTFKVVPISSQTGTTPGQRVLIPASAVATSAQNQISSSQIVMLPSHLLQQVKKGDCKLVPAVSATGIPALRATTTVNGSRKIAPAPPVPPLKVKDPPVPLVASTTARIATPPPLLPSTAASPPSPPSPTTQTSPQRQSVASASASPEGLNASATGGLPQVKVEPKQEPWSGDESYLEANGIRPRKPCNCTKSMCLKLYCDCFANGEFCYQCNCTCCYNNLEHEEERQRAIKSCLERNPTAFRPKIGKTLAGSEERRHNRGCNCKRSGCLKNYCECFEAKIPCSKNCKCAGCKNTENYPWKRGSGDEDQSRYKTDSKAYELHTGHMYSSACRQAFSMMSPELIQATCQCLIAQAEKWDKSDENEQCEEAQKLIIEEFGHCLAQIIDCVTKSIPQQPPVSTS